MTVKECYDYMGGGYEDVIGRLMNDQLIIKFANKFLDDPSYDTLFESLENGDDETAFRAAHTLKGVCQNLGFYSLYKSSEALTEALRGGKKGDTSSLEEKVKSDYVLTIEAIGKMQ